jgi:hypothetical protein
MAKQAMVLKWLGEDSQPISREEAAKVIRGNRRQAKSKPELRISVQRKCGETYIVSQLLGVGCCIGRAA